MIPAKCISSFNTMIRILFFTLGLLCSLPGFSQESILDSLQKELEMVVKTEKSSKSEIIREAITRYLASKRFQQLRKKVLPFAEAQGLITDEDIFNTIS